MAETVYIVQRIDWEYNDEWFYPGDDTVLKAFRQREHAERYWQQMEYQARSDMEREAEVRGWSRNLSSTFGGFNCITSLSPLLLGERLQALGLPPAPDWHGPPPADDPWRIYQGWWDAAWQQLQPAQSGAFWNLWDRLNFFKVVEVEVHA